MARRGHHESVAAPVFVRRSCPACSVERTPGSSPCPPGDSGDECRPRTSGTHLSGAATNFGVPTSPSLHARGRRFRGRLAADPEDPITRVGRPPREYRFDVTVAGKGGMRPSSCRADCAGHGCNRSLNDATAEGHRQPIRSRSARCAGRPCALQRASEAQTRLPARARRSRCAARRRPWGRRRASNDAVVGCRGARRG